MRFASTNQPKATELSLLGVIVEKENLYFN